jgi:hypothetical protein
MTKGEGMSPYRETLAALLREASRQSAPFSKPDPRLFRRRYNDLEFHCLFAAP